MLGEIDLAEAEKDRANDFGRAFGKALIGDSNEEAFFTWEPNRRSRWLIGQTLPLVSMRYGANRM